MITLMNTENYMELNEQRRDLLEVVRKYENQPFVQIAAVKAIAAALYEYITIKEQEKA